MCKKTVVKIVSLLGAAALLAGCQILIQKPQVQSVSLSYANITKSTQTLGVRLSVRNPNPFPIHIESGAASIAVNGRSFAHGAISKAITLPAGHSVAMTVPIWTNTKAIESILPEVLMNGKAHYIISGKVIVRDNGANAYPFTYNGVITFPEVKKMISHIQ